MKERRKRIIAVLVAAVMMVAFALAGMTSAKADSVSKTIKLKIGSKTVYINGQPEQMDVAPFIDPHSNRTLVPIRFVAEGLGGKVSWHPHERFVGVLVGTNKVGLWIGKKTAVVTVKPATWHSFDEMAHKVTDQAPEIVPPGRTMIPLRFVSESVGAKVEWNGQTREITITLTYQPLAPGDLQYAIPFDRFATPSSGYIFNPYGTFALDPNHNSIFTYGFKMAGERWAYRYDTDKMYLFKYDKLTGIRINEKLLFSQNSLITSVDNSNGSYLDYDPTTKMLYTGTVVGLVDENVTNTLNKLYVIFKAVNPVTMSVKWAKMYNVHDLFISIIPSAYGGRGHSFVEIDHSLPHLLFTGDGSKAVFMLPVSDISDFETHNYSESPTYDYLCIGALDTKTGNLVWHRTDDGWTTYGYVKGAIPTYQGRYMYFIEYPYSFIAYNKSAAYGHKADVPSTYQNKYFAKLIQKLIPITHVKSNLWKDSSNPPDQQYLPERLLCVDMQTGKTVWSHYYLDNEYDPIGVHSSPYIQIVNGVLYTLEYTYDPGVLFKGNYGYNYGMELLRYDPITGKQILPLWHKTAYYLDLGWHLLIVKDKNGQLYFSDIVEGTPIVMKNGTVAFVTHGCDYDPMKTPPPYIRIRFINIYNSSLDGAFLPFPQKLFSYVNTDQFSPFYSDPAFTYRYFTPEKNGKRLHNHIYPPNEGDESVNEDPRFTDAFGYKDHVYIMTKMDGSNAFDYPFFLSVYTGD